jgi:F-type H+-transporting ATPase subunit delta
MSKTAILAARYARGLAEAASARGDFADLLEDMAVLRDLLDPAWGEIVEPELIDFLNNPLVTPEMKTGLLRRLSAALGLRPSAAAFLEILARRGRFRLATAILRAFDDVARETTGERTVFAESGRPLPAAQRERLRAALEKEIGARVRLVTAATPRLVSGLRLREGDQRWDFSVRGRLNRLRNRFRSRYS